MTESGARTGDIANAIVEAVAAERSGRGFGLAGAALKRELAARRKRLLEQHSRGEVIIAKMAAAMDEALGALFANAAEALPAKAKVALVATGGYGRAGLAPYSDIDLLILHGGVADADIKGCVDALLYPLWDAGLTVGQGVHTPASAIRLAASDMTAMTAYLDSRLLFGDAALFKDFQSKFEALRFRSKAKFVKAKRAELEERHERSEQSRYLAEPDIKEGKGGLRDIHAIGWIYRALYGKPLQRSGKGRSLFRPDEIMSLDKAERFLLTLRAHLHDLRGRADERLSFDIQPALAERLGYADRPEMSAAERMMRHYFVTAIEIGRLTRIFWARIEEENARLIDRAPTPLPKSLASDEIGPKTNLRIKNGRLDFANAAAAARTPLDLFRYFRAFAKRPDYDFHPDALGVIAKSAHLVTTEVRRDADIARIFLAALTTAKDPVKLLRVMSETSLLGKFIPSFGQIVGRIHYGLYRRFSLDEHIFQSIGILRALFDGDLKSEHPIATGILETRKDAETFFIAVLLHEAGWSLKDRTPESTEALVARVARRIGAADENVDAIAWCAARPLFMVRVVERRNLGDAEAIARFARDVGDERRLELLLVLTVCHLRVVSDNAWDDWTRRQISALYFGSRAFMKGGEDALGEWMAARAGEARAAAAEALEDWPKAERDAFLKGLSDETISTLDPATFARAAGLALSADGAGVAASLREGAIEAIVYADDRAGLLADLSGAAAAAGGDVRSVHAMTLDNGKIIDVFTIMAPEAARAEASGDFVRRLHAALLAAAEAAPARAPAMPRRIGDRRALFKVASSVEIDLEASSKAVVVETEGRDRPGLLYSLTSELADLGVVIRSAHIATYGERAVDAFYLQTAEGEKITDKRALAAIERRLAAALDGAPKPAL